ncbi:MAG TPA: hypothetical protein VF765_14230 [Polyangiaceae bacterium]
MRSALALSGFAVLLVCADASAQQQQPQQQPELTPETKIDFSTKAEPGLTQPAATSASESTLPEPPAEAPPVRPRHKGVVLETTAGALGFAGNFRHVAPPGFWLHTQLGYEVLRWLMVYGSAELALTDTSEAADPSHSMAFPIWGFGGGARVTVHATDRVAFFVQGDIGALTAYVPHESLAILGYPNAESPHLAIGGRLGVEWYQIDRHIALVAQGGARDAQGFSRSIGGGDTPILWDAALGLRYTF